MNMRGSMGSKREHGKRVRDPMFCRRSEPQGKWAGALGMIGRISIRLRYSSYSSVRSSLFISFLNNSEFSKYEAM